MPARLLCLLLLIAQYSPAQPASSEQPATTQLKLAVILTRHGVRSPTSSMKGYSRHDWPGLENDWRVECCGDLTPRGAELVFLMGAYYRSHFAQQKLFPEVGCVA